MKYLKLLRTSHYLKNIYVFLPVFFGGEILNKTKVTASLNVFICFCLAASAVYIMNDIADIDLDRTHPIKKSRAIPSGLIKTEQAFLIAGILAILALVYAFYIDVRVIFFILTYLIINILYTVKLKNIAIVDVTIISIGFVLRVITGGMAANIEVSRWLIIMSFLLSMFLALSKRMDDLHLLSKSATMQVRNSLSGYSIEFLQITTSMLTGVLMVCYIMYIISPEITHRLGENSFYTMFFVLLGLLRYLQLTFVTKTSGSPVMILIRDRFIQLNIVCWALTFFILIYIK